MAKNTKTAEDVRNEIADRPRQSVVRFVEYFNTIRETAPDRLEELFGSQVDALSEVADSVRNPVAVAMEKAANTQLDLAVKALTNEDEKNGYAHYSFDRAAFDEKTRVRTPRAKKSVVEKVEDTLSNASPEDLDALAEILKARGVTL